MDDRLDSVSLVYSQIKKLAIAFLLLCLAFELGISIYELVLA